MSKRKRHETTTKKKRLRGPEDEVEETLVEEIEESSQGHRPEATLVVLNERKIVTLAPITSLGLDEYIQHDTYKAMCNLLPNVNLKTPLGLLEGDSNIAICLPTERSLLNDIRIQLRDHVRDSMVLFFEDLRKSAPKAQLERLSMILVGQYQDNIEKNDWTFLTSALWQDFLRLFFESCLSPQLMEKGFPHLLGEDQQTSEQKNLSRHLAKLLDYESKFCLPTSLLEFVAMFQNAGTAVFPLPSRSVAVFGTLLKNATFETRADSASYSIQALHHFRAMYRAFVATYMKTIVLIGGEFLPDCIAQLWTPADPKKTRRTRLTDPFFSRIIHCYHGQSSWLLLLKTHFFFLYSSKWKALFSSEQIKPCSIALFDNVIMSGIINIEPYRSNIKRLLMDLMCLKPIYEVYRKNLNDDSQAEKIHLQKLVELQQELVQCWSLYLHGQWCKHKKLWLEFNVCFLLPYSFTKTKTLLDHQKKLYGVSEEKLRQRVEQGDFALTEKEKKVTEDQERERFQVLRDDTKKNQVYIKSVEEMSIQAALAQQEREKKERSTEIEVKDAILVETDTSVNRLFTPLVVFFMDKDAADYNDRHLAAYCHQKAFEPDQTVATRASSKVCGSKRVPLAVFDMQEDEKEKAEDDDKVQDLEDYSFLKVPLKKKPNQGKGTPAASAEEVKAEMKILDELIETDQMPWQKHLLLCAGAIYRLTVSVQANGKTIPVKTRVKILWFQPLTQRNLSLIDDDESDEKKVEGEVEIAAWLTQQKHKAGRSPHQQLSAMQLQRDGAFHDMGSEDYTNSEVYKKKLAKIAEVKKQLGQKSNFIRIPYVVTEDQKTAWPLLPCCFEVKLGIRPFYFTAYPLKPGYAVSLRDLRPHPNQLFRNLSVSLEQLRKCPLLMYAIMENCPQSEIEIVPDIPFHKEMLSADDAAEKIHEFVLQFLAARDKVSKVLF